MGSLSPSDRPTERAIMPARLIDVGHSEDPAQTRLIVCKEKGGVLPYMTLSHRWPLGRQAQTLVKLTKNTLQTMKMELPVSSLNIKFQQAILVTRRLGMKYLWIDALCILQDDNQEWANESLKMGEIYKNAVCNIAAGGDFDPTAGLFRVRNPVHVRPLKIDLKWDFNVPLDTFKQPTFLRGQYYVIEAGFISNNILNEPINSRAWVLQERLLSPRILYFGTHQVFWKDNDGYKCESFPQGFPRTKDVNLASAQSDRLVPDGLVPDGPYTTTRESLPHESRSLVEQRNRIYEEWNRLVILYSRCDLTRSSDKLIALSGLSRQFGLFLDPEKYCAGLWESTMPRSLLWRTKNGRKADGTFSARLAVSSLPSWSWASVNGEIEPHDFRGTDEEIRVSNLEVYTVLLPDEDTSASRDCLRIRLRGRLLPMEKAQWYDWKEESLWMPHSSRVCPRIRGFTGEIARCSIDDREQFLRRWDDRIFRAIMLLRFFLMLLYAVLVIVIGNKIVDRVSLTCISIPLIPLGCLLINDRFVAHVGKYRYYKSPGVFLLPVSETRWDTEGLVVQSGEMAGEYNRIGHFIQSYNSSLRRLCKELNQQVLVLV